MHNQHQMRDRGAEALAMGLGWFSVALGIAELAAPRSVAQLIGVRTADDGVVAVVRACGARELGNGIAILAQPDRAGWLWGRVGGDALDLSLLASAAPDSAGGRRRLGIAAAAVLGVTAADIACAARLSRQPYGATRQREAAAPVRVERVTTINKPIEEVYAFWRNFQNFPRFMRHLESVEVIDDRRSRWKAKAPAGMTVEWEAEITDDREHEWISWRSLEGSDVQHTGSVQFRRAPGARGTEVRVKLDYRPPAGAIGRGIAWLFGEEPDQQIHEDLHRFKQLMETGEIALSDGPSLWRPARPAKSPDQVYKLAGVQR